MGVQERCCSFILSEEAVRGLNVAESTSAEETPRGEMGRWVAAH